MCCLTVGGVAPLYKSGLTNNQRRAIWEILLTKRRPNDQNKLVPSAAREVGLQFNVASTYSHPRHLQARTGVSGSWKRGGRCVGAQAWLGWEEEVGVRPSRSCIDRTSGQWLLIYT